ncbi:hypothetical protein PISMIDRAFT_199042 [Pisolithus microcarpus 441]|uniref:Uncharacterized protein n=1 Tax=Pisolithus microcarpus 441 TaxID=765257 RepID=A0A0C9Z6Q1_9AGAM|nr:hypothetical protein BKA83DRAFT_199042 [Pisolithus microcarpus]KIK18102.1 hypothetical protein PISMIDRAFT_199042 [Pisolithus microcarpus 441]
MSPIPLPVPPFRSTSAAARSNVIRHVKRAHKSTNAAVIVLAVICLSLLIWILILIARRLYRAHRFSSPSTPGPNRRRRPTFWRRPSPPNLRLFRNLNGPRRTPTVNHPDPRPTATMPPRASARPWLVYRPAYPQCHPPRCYGSPHVCENCYGDLRPHRRRGADQRAPARSDSNTNLLGNLPSHRQPRRPSNKTRRSQVRRGVPGKYVRPFLETSVTTEGVGEDDVRVSVRVFCAVC